MIIIGCDFHPSFQQIAMLDTETGATEEHKLMHTGGEAERFYRKLASPAIVGIETVEMISGSCSCCKSWAMRYGSAMQRKFVPAMCGNRRRIAAMQNTYCSCWWKGGFHGSGYQAPRCGIIASC